MTHWTPATLYCFWLYVQSFSLASAEIGSSDEPYAFKTHINCRRLGFRTTPNGETSSAQESLAGFQGEGRSRGKRHVLEEEGTWVGRRGGGKGEKERVGITRE
jgi:hypothetical protein